MLLAHRITTPRAKSEQLTCQPLRLPAAFLSQAERGGQRVSPIILTFKCSLQAAGAVPHSRFMGHDTVAGPGDPRLSY
jgi:hypothetical protein